MLFTPAAVISVPAMVERICSAGSGLGRAERSRRRLRTDRSLSVAARMPLRLIPADLKGRARALHRIYSGGIQAVMIDNGSADGDPQSGHRDFCQLRKIAPRGETRPDGAKNKNISLRAQGPTLRNLSDCASSSPRSWPAGHALRSVYPATSPRHSRSQAVARPASPDARPSRNDLLAR